MTQRNNIFLIIYLIVSFAGGIFAGSIIQSIFSIVDSLEMFFVYFASILIIALFALPILNNLLE